MFLATWFGALEEMQGTIVGLSIGQQQEYRIPFDCRLVLSFDIYLLCFLSLCWKHFSWYASPKCYIVQFWRGHHATIVMCIAHRLLHPSARSLEHCYCPWNMLLVNIVANVGTAPRWVNVAHCCGQMKRWKMHMNTLLYVPLSPELIASSKKPGNKSLLQFCPYSDRSVILSEYYLPGISPKDLNHSTGRRGISTHSTQPEIHLPWISTAVCLR